MSGTTKIARPLYYAGSALLLAGSIAAAVMVSRESEWHPLTLVLLLGTLTLFGQQVVAVIRSQVVCALNVSLVLAMCLLGPAPAVACGVVAMTWRSLSRRLPLSDWAANLSTFAICPLVGGLIVRALIGDVHNPYNAATEGFEFAIVVLGVFLITGTLNFLLIAVQTRVFWGRRFRPQVMELFVPLLPAELVAGLLTVVAALAYTNFGLGWSLGSVVALLTFQVLIVRMIRAENVAEQLRTSVFALVSAQVGTIKAAVKFLDARDPGSERHAAAVAIYARELAAEVGCSEDEQNRVHAAGLAHDIGRLAFHDHVLNASGIVDEEDWKEIRRHPIEGSAWVGHIHGYGPVADIILSHHERWDGTGYPDEFIGPEIPLLSRILAICEAFDAMTARQTYRARMTAQDAFEQLRRGAGTQFDPELVESFVEMRRREGAKHLTIEDADFDAELDFERRIRMLTDPENERSSTVVRTLLPRLGKLLGS